MCSGHLVSSGPEPMTDREISLEYFRRFQTDILGLLEVMRPAEALDDDERVALVWAYLDVVSD